MKLSSTFLLGILFCFLQTWGMDKVASCTLSRENAWLFHCTSLFPQDGVMIAGRLTQLALSDNKSISDEFLTENMQRQRAQVSLSWIRATIHWCVNSISEPHTQTIRDGAGTQKTITITRENSPYCIAEPMSALKNKELKGYWQDVFHLGSHTLSDQAVIFVKESHTEHEPLIGSFKGKIIHYTGSLSTAIENFLAEKNCPLISRKIAESSSQKSSSTNSNQDIHLGKSRSSEKALSEMLHLDNMKHDDTELSELERNLGVLFSPISGYLFSAQIREKHDRLKNGDLFVCSNCKKSAQEVKLPQLLSCSQCDAASYCSKMCQTEHWKSHHKKKCGTLATARASLNSSFVKYRMIFAQVSADASGLIVTELHKNFRKLKALYKGSPEQNVLSKYEKITFHFYNHFYSSETEYIEKRNNFRFDTLDGFGRYCHAVLTEAGNL